MNWNWNKIVGTLFFCLLMPSLWIGVYAQDKQDQIHSARVAFISERLHLNPAEAQKFWPVYNEYWSKKTEIRKQIRVYNSENASLSISNEKLKSNLIQIAQWREKESLLEKEYLQRFLLILNPRQVHELYQSEKEFIKVILKKVNEE
ncbi:MAG: hypothetical protein MUF42_08455 [Cytophagaceae bacterium]|jgi:hypothetical protein|nr:hypothetical protein [Cytophagaceae bacterium]